MLMNKPNKHTITALGFTCNKCLTAMLELAPLIAECLNTKDIPVGGRIQLSWAFGEILSCSSSRLRHFANTGMLIMLSL